MGVTAADIQMGSAVLKVAVGFVADLLKAHQASKTTALMTENEIREGLLKRLEASGELEDPRVLFQMGREAAARTPGKAMGAPKRKK